MSWNSSVLGVPLITHLFQPTAPCAKVAAVLPAILLVAASVCGQSPHDRHAERSAPEAVAEVSEIGAARAGVLKVDKFERDIPDFVVLDQDGNRVRFYTDLIKGKVVILSFFYTECNFVCDVQGQNFTRLQTLLGDSLGREVFIVSVTRTPVADPPAKLKEWARRHRVKKGWTLVTGKTPDIARLVGTFARDNLGPQEMHAAPIFIGNDATHSWIFSNGLTAPDQLAGLIRKVLAK